MVDTNVLVYAADGDSPYHDTVRPIVDEWRQNEAAWYLTWSIVYEFLRVVTHPRVFKKPWTVAEGWRFVEGLLASPGIEVLVETDRHSAVIREVFGQHPFVSGNLLHDAHTAVLMREHGVRQIFTRDTDFHRFPFVEVMDPLALDTP